ncbi:MAG: DegT/DnrJ/EryC1/StrS family aminotransferase [Spirosomataceae bacterium]
MKINVTKTFLPPIEEYQAYISQIWENNWLTNNGPFVQKLEEMLSAYLGIPYILYVGNGTIALQLAIKALDIKGEVLTTPFSYCATTTSLLWENCTPVFVDIQASDMNIDADKIEQKITDKTTAILATHVYGRPCDVVKIEQIAQKYNLKVIYDGAHAFGVKLHGKSALAFGDISTCSFHATKVFHTIEGGCIAFHDKNLYEKIKLLRSFGHVNDDYYSVGINGKNSEFHAVMGLTNLPHLPTIIETRKIACEKYDSLLPWNKLTKPSHNSKDLVYNYAYYPVVFESEESLLDTMNALKAEGIQPRRYFYPSLNQLSYLKTTQSCPISESLSLRVLSLPLYANMEMEVVEKVAHIVNQTLSK